MDQILTNPQTVAEWLWFAVTILFVVIVGLGGGGQLILWVKAHVERAEAITEKIKAEAKKLSVQAETLMTALAPAGSPQQQYIAARALEFTKADLVALFERLAGVDLPEEAEARLRVLEMTIDNFVADITDGVNEDAATNEAQG